MAREVRRVLAIDGSIDAVWNILSDPAVRAEAIGLVESYTVENDTTVTWHVRLPIPLVRSTVPVTTTDTTREPPELVEFTASSTAFKLRGRHRLETVDGQTHVENVFAIDGFVPGLERFFVRHLDQELKSLQTTLRRELATTT